MAKYISPLDELANHDCTRCELHETTDRVCVMGRGSGEAKILILGEAPGGNEERTGRVFSGPAGRMLDSALEQAGISQSDVYISNVVKCRPPDNRRPDRQEWDGCDRYLVRELKRLRPDYILLLGNTALHAVWGKSGITKHRGVRLEGAKHPHVGGALLMASIHPAYCLRNPGQTSTFYEDIKRFSRLISGTLSVAEVKRYMVTTENGLRKVMERLAKAEVIAYDVENRHYPWSDEWDLVCLGMSDDGEHSFVIPLQHPESIFRKKWRRLLIEYVKPVLERPGLKLIAQNGKHDNVQLAGAGIYLEHTFDIMLAAHLLDENRPKNLGFLSQTLLGADQYKGMVETKPDKILKQPIRDLCDYNGYDVGYTWQLYPRLKSELLEYPRLTRLMVKLCMPASHTIQRVEYRGMPVDRKRLKKRLKKLYEMIDEKREVMGEYLPPELEDLNPNSPKQLGTWLFTPTKKGGLGLSPLEITKSGAYSTREAVLLHYRDHPAIAALLEYRTLYLKWQRTCFEPWLERLDSRNRLHTTYKLYGTVTGRASGDLQQVPRNPFIRTVFGPDEGWVWIQADASQVELRIAAHCSGEQRMIRAFGLGEDLHLATAVALTGKAPHEVTKEERKKAKAVNFGFLYGMGATKFQAYAFENYDVKVTIEEAQLARNRYFEMFPGLRPWHERQERVVKGRGYVQSPIGRIRHLPDVNSQDRGVQAEAVRQAINSPVQGCASDIMFFGMVLLDQILDENECFMVGTLHDGIFLECREDKVEKWAPIIKETLETLPLKRTFGLDLAVPLIWDVEWGGHWGEPHSIVDSKGEIVGI